MIHTQLCKKSMNFTLPPAKTTQGTITAQPLQETSPPKIRQNFTTTARIQSQCPQPSQTFFAVPLRTTFTEEGKENPWGFLSRPCVSVSPPSRKGTKSPNTQTDPTCLAREGSQLSLEFVHSHQKSRRISNLRDDGSRSSRA